MKDKLQEIYENFGSMHQRKKLMEECKEYLEDPNDSEIADLYVLTSQLYNNQLGVRRQVEFKLARTISRIRNKYYEGEKV